MSQLKEINKKFYKPAKVFMLDNGKETPDRFDLVYNSTYDSKYIWDKAADFKFDRIDAKSQYLYVTVEEEINPGEYGYNILRNVIDKLNIKASGKKNYKKIIATNNPSLGLHMVSKEFVDIYASSDEPITDILVEYYRMVNKRLATKEWFTNVKFGKNSMIGKVFFDINDGKFVIKDYEYLTGNGGTRIFTTKGGFFIWNENNESVFIGEESCDLKIKANTISIKKKEEKLYNISEILSILEENGYENDPVYDMFQELDLK